MPNPNESRPERTWSTFIEFLNSEDIRIPITPEQQPITSSETIEPTQLATRSFRIDEYLSYLHTQENPYARHAQQLIEQRRQPRSRCEGVPVKPITIKEDDSMTRAEKIDRARNRLKTFRQHTEARIIEFHRAY